LSKVVCLLVFCVMFVHSCLSVSFLYGVFPQMFVCWFSVWRLSTVVCWFSVSTVVCLLSSLSVGFVSAYCLVFCVVFVHSCLSVGFLCDFVHSCLSLGLFYDLCPQLFVYWFSV
jgi:hypothetical protein